MADRGTLPDDRRRVEVHPGCDAVVEFDPETTFECVDGCTWCCHHGVLLYEHDFRALAERENLAEATTRFRGADFVRRSQVDRDDHVADDGHACHFLTDEGRCGLHAEHDWKPTRCSVFPLAVRRRDGVIHVDVRETATVHCEGLGESDRRLIDHLDAFLPSALWNLENPDTNVEL